MTEQAPRTGRHRWRLVWRAVRRRCPRCGAPDVWVSFTRMRPECQSCGLQLDRGESDYFYGAYMLNFIAAELFAVAAFAIGLLVTWPTPPWNFLLGLTVTMAIVAPIVLYPTSKVLWLALDLMFRPNESF